MYNIRACTCTLYPLFVNSVCVFVCVYVCVCVFVCVYVCVCGVCVCAMLSMDFDVKTGLDCSLTTSLIAIGIQPPMGGPIPLD